jgi:hypothetical protein
MNTVQCENCENRYLSKNASLEKISPWECPNCNNDTAIKIQKDLNELFKLIGFKAIDRLTYRANRVMSLCQMYKKQDEQPVDVCIG